MTEMQTAPTPTGFEAMLRADVCAAREGDRTAYERLVRENRNLVSTIALAIVRDRAASEDVAQDVFVSAWRSMHSLRNADSFLPWLRELTRNRAKMHVRARSRFEARHAPWDEKKSAASNADDAHEEMTKREERAILEETFAELQGNEREILTLYYRENSSVAHVAELLGLSEDATKKRLERARARLREHVLARFGEVARASAPNAAFLAAIGAAIAVASPSTAAASLGAKASSASLGAKIAAIFPAFGAIAIGIGGVLFGARAQLRRARDEEERRGIRRIAFVSAASAPLTALAMWLALRIGSRPLYLASFLTVIPNFGVTYFWWLPRVVARRVACELAEDPSAKIRHRREALVRALSFACGFACGLAATIYGMLGR